MLPALRGIDMLFTPLLRAGSAAKRESAQSVLRTSAM